MQISVIILLGLAAAVYGRTMNLEKWSWSLTDDLQDDESDLITTDVLHSLFGAAVDTMEPQDCKGGRCEFCSGSVVNACFVATLGKNSIDISVKINGFTLASTSITVPNPPPICQSMIPGIPNVSDVCVEFKNIDLGKGAGCVYISLKVKIGPIRKKVTFKIACFQLAGKADDVTDNVDQSLLFKSIEKRL